MNRPIILQNIVEENTCLCCGQSNIRQNGFLLCGNCLAADCRYARPRCHASGRMRPEYRRAQIANSYKVLDEQVADLAETTASPQRLFGRPVIIQHWAGQRLNKNAQWARDSVGLVLYYRPWHARDRYSVWRYSKYRDSNAFRIEQTIVPTDIMLRRYGADSYWCKRLRDWTRRGFTPVPFHDPFYGDIPLGEEGLYLSVSATIPSSLHGLPIIKHAARLIDLALREARRNYTARDARTLASLSQKIKTLRDWRDTWDEHGQDPILWIDVTDVYNTLVQIYGFCLTHEESLTQALGSQAYYQIHGPLPYNPSWLEDLPY